MMEQDAEEACGARHARSDGRRGHRWGRTQGKIGFHAGKVAIERPRVRGLDGKELALPSWERAVAEDWLGKWAMNLMLINVSTRKFRPSGAAARGRCSGAGGGRSVEVGGLAPLRGAVGCAHEGMDGCGSVRPRPPGGADRRHPHERGPRAGGGDRDRRRGRQASARAHGGGDRERRRRAGPDRQSRRARARSSGAAFVHHRRVEGARQGDPAQLRAPRADPALPDPQGPQHHGASISRSACLGPACVAPSLGTRRCGEGGEADPQSRPAPGARLGQVCPKRASWKASTKSSPSAGFDCRRSCGARSPVPTSSRI